MQNPPNPPKTGVHTSHDTAGGASPARTCSPGPRPQYIDPSAHLRVIRHGPRLVEVYPFSAAEYRAQDLARIRDAQRAIQGTSHHAPGGYKRSHNKGRKRSQR